MTFSLRILRPCSRERGDLLTPRLDEFAAAGITPLFEDRPEDPSWTYTASSIEHRVEALYEAFRESSSDFVLAARGGYGASDLLPHLDWPKLRQLPPKILIGFSDVSALHSAFYAKLGRSGLHGPMPATALWGKDGVRQDVDELFRILKDIFKGRLITSNLPVKPLRDSCEPISGRLFGGCFTVLTNLIGTSYFPKNLRDHILFIEDTDENPARLMRAFNQWLQSGSLNGVKAIVVGYLRALGQGISDCAPFVYEQFASRCGIPVFSSTAFGHTSPNFPLMIGANAVIHRDQLTWHYQHPLQSGEYT